MARRDPPAPWASAEAPEHITGAIKALASGNANESQQKASLKWIIEVLCATYDLSFRPNDERGTAFAEGKRHVGNQIVRQIKMVSKERRGG